MRLRRKLLQGSGATLGFIGYNLPGAYAGYTAGGYIDDRMAPASAAYFGHKRKRSELHGRTAYKKHKGWRSHGVPAHFAGSRRAARRKGRTGPSDDAGHSRFSNVHRTRKRFLKGFKKIAAPTFMNSAITSRFSPPTTSGEQGVHLLPSWQGSALGAELPQFGVGMLNDINNALAAIEPTTATQNSAGNTTALTRKIMVKFVSTAYNIKNVTNVPIRVILYNCVARRDQQATYRPDQAWTGGVQDEFVTLPSGVAPTNAQASNMPGATPFQSQQFCQYYKVRKVTKFELHPGSLHVHRVTTKPGGLLSSEYFRNFQLYRGLSSFVMMVVTGGIVDNAVGFGPSVVTTSDYAIDVVTETRIEATTLERSRSAYIQWNNIPTGIADVAQQVLNEDQDIVNVIAAA